MGNPVKINHDQPCVRRIGIVMLLSLFVLSLVIVGNAGSAIDDSCSIYNGILPCQPVWMFLYYRFYSRLLCKVLDCCSCCEHGRCYAFWNYAIWGKVFTSFFRAAATVYILSVPISLLLMLLQAPSAILCFVSVHSHISQFEGR